MRLAVVEDREEYGPFDPFFSGYVVVEALSREGA